MCDGRMRQRIGGEGREYMVISGCVGMVWKVRGREERTDVYYVMLYVVVASML